MSETKTSIEDRLAAIEKALQQKPTNDATFTALSREERIANVLKDYDTQIDAKIKAAMEAREKAFDAKLAQLNAEKDIQDEEVLRRYLGVAKDQSLKMSDIPAIIKAMRKAALETEEPGKKTPAVQEKAGPEGNKPTNPFEEQYKHFSGGN